MPTSYGDDKELAKQWIDELNPKFVMDIGIGAGTYSDLAKQPHQHWLGIEAWANYVVEFELQNKYDKIIIADVRYLDFNKIGHMNLIIAADVLEHMKQDEAKDVITEMLNHSDYILICFPNEHHDQEAWEGNYFEIHQDHWTHKDMAELLGDRIVKQKEGERLSYFLARGDIL